MSRRTIVPKSATPYFRHKTYCVFAALSVALICVLITGCVHRQFTITTTPPGAIVQVNGKTVGATPVDVPFTYYGDYRLTILRDGFQTLVVDYPVPAPWYEWLPFEFISEHLVPYTIRDHRHQHFDLLPLPAVSPEGVLNRSEILRSKGKTIGTPPAPEGTITVPAGRIPNEPFETLPVPSEVPKQPSQPQAPEQPQRPVDTNWNAPADAAEPVVIPVPPIPPKQ